MSKLLMPSDLYRVVHVISGLHTGGAELTLYRQLCFNPQADRILVISLGSQGEVADKIRSLGINVIQLGLKSQPWRLFTLGKILRQHKPDVVHCWMYHANIIGGLLGRIYTSSAIVWGLHHNRVSRQESGVSTSFFCYLCAFFSKRIPARIICPSRAVIESHVAMGYCREKLFLLPLGLDFTVFSRNESKRRMFRSYLELPEKTLLVGNIARVTPEKNIPEFLQLAVELKKKIDQPIRFLLAGKGLDKNNAQLLAELKELNIEAEFLLAGECNDMPELLNGLDLFVSVSGNEAFSLSLLEAIACRTAAFALDSADPVGLLDSSGVLAFRATDINGLQDCIINFLQASKAGREQALQLVYSPVKNQYTDIGYQKAIDQLYQELAAE